MASEPNRDTDVDEPVGSTDPPDTEEASSDHESQESAMQTLHDATREMMTAETREAIGEIGLDAAVEALGLTVTGLHFFDEEEHGLVPVAWTSTIEEEIGEPPTLGPGSTAWDVYDSGDPVTVEDFLDEDSDNHNPDSSFRSEMVVPLGEHGVALFSATEPHAFDADDQRFAEIMCANATSAMDRIDREENLRKREAALQRQIELQEALTAEIEERVEELSETSEHVSASSAQISDIAENQATKMDAVAEEIAALSSVVEEVATLSDQVRATSAQTLAIAENGFESSTDATGVMEDIETATTEAAAEFDDLHDEIREIDELVEVINEVADRTNLLALNASIEAARAGEEGRGFAVVAEEVKSLAEEAQEQAGRIETRIDGIQSDTDETVDTLEAATDRVAEGMEAVERTRENFADIVEAVTETSEGIEEVADATDEQAASSEEIAQMIDEAVREADEVSTEIQGIAAANRQQAEKVDDIEASLERASEHREGTEDE